MQVLGADRMMRPVYPALDQAPEAVHGVRMGDPVYVHLGGVLNLQVLKASTPQTAVAGHIVCDDGALGRDVLSDVRHERLALYVWNNLHDDPALAFRHTHRNRLSSGPTPALTGPPAADVGFINLDVAGELARFFVHEYPNVLEDSPGRLVGDSKLTLNLLGRDAAAGGGH